MIKLRVRPLTADDVPLVVELLQNLSSFYPTASTQKSLWDDFSLWKNTFSLVAEHADYVVGYGSLVIETKIRGGRLGHIEDVVTSPEYRRLGVGRAIVSGLMDVAKAHGCYKVCLHTKERNANFYASCGMVISGLSMEKYL